MRKLDLRTGKPVWHAYRSRQVRQGNFPGAITIMIPRFVRDLPRMIGRRRLPSIMGGLGAFSVSGVAAAALDLVAIPWETAGLFPADGTNIRQGQLVNVLTREPATQWPIHSNRPHFLISMWIISPGCSRS